MSKISKRMFVVIFVSLLMLGMLNVAMPVSAKPTVIHVYPSDSIQAAVDAAPVGAKIIVHAGTYNEKVIIEKQLTLIGEEAVLDLAGITIPVVPNGWGNAGIFVAAGGVTASGFTIKNVPYYPNPVNPSGLPFAFGIRYFGSFVGGLIENNEVISDYNGIGVTGAFETSGISGVVVRNNEVAASIGILGFNAPGLKITSNQIAASRFVSFSGRSSSITIGGSFSYSDVTISNNQIDSDDLGVVINGASGREISDVQIDNNEINSIMNDGILLENAVDIEVKENIVNAAAGAIPIVEGAGITVKNNILHAGSLSGIGFGFNTPIIAKVTGGIFAGNEIYGGIGFDYLEDVIIKDNTLHSSGIYVSAGVNIAIKKNSLDINGEYAGITLGAIPLGIVSDSSIIGNEIFCSGPQQNGIDLNDVDDIEVKDNIMYGSYQGITVAVGMQVTIKNNVLHSSYIGINTLSEVSNVLIKGNAIYSDDVGVLGVAVLDIEIRDNELYAGGHGISLTQMGMTNPVITGNVIYSGFYGINLNLISEATIKNNEIHVETNSRPIKGGIVIFGSIGSEVASNTISGDFNSGISLLNSGAVISSTNTIKRNVITGVYKPNDAGIRLFPETTGNIVKQNTITGVNQPILDLGTDNIIIP